MEKTHFPPKSAMLKDRDFEEKLLKNRTSAKSAGIEKFHKKKKKKKNINK